MKYVFNAPFLKIVPPATSFADAWELLCLELMQAENPYFHFQRLIAPDRGVDILRRSPATGYQCKSDQRGAIGSISARTSMASLKTAVAHRAALGWDDYCFATNADYSGEAVKDIRSLAESLGLKVGAVSFLGPGHWSDLCERHLARVEHWLDYRLLVTEQQVIEAFRKARYLEHKVEEYRQQIAAGHFVLELANNRTPLRLAIPFSPHLTVEHCLNVGMQLLDISLESQTYPDLSASARPSISITIDKVPQSFNKKIGDFAGAERARLQLWITVIWRDLPKESREDTVLRALTRRTEHQAAADGVRTIASEMWSRLPTPAQRYEQSLQMTMWRSAAALADRGSK